MENDADLVRRCVAGEASAWRDLIQRYRRLIYSIPVAFRLSPGDADEVFQAVSLKLLRYLPGLRSSETLPSWLSVTTRRECLALVRKQRRLQPLGETQGDELPAPDPDVEGALHDIDCQHTLALAFERLDEACRVLLRALFLEEPRPPYEVLAARLGRPVGSLGPTRARCLRKLREIYLSLGGESP